MPPTSLRLRSQLVAAGLLATLACSEPEHPPYTRLQGPAPTIETASAGTTLVVFWATWCAPCREELPALRELARDAPSRIRVLTFGEDEEEAQVREFFRGPPPPELGYRRDVDGRAAAAFGVDALPAAFLVAHGQVLARFAGPRDWSSRGMRRLLAKLANEASPSGPSGARPGVDDPRGDR